MKTSLKKPKKENKRNIPDFLKKLAHSLNKKIILLVIFFLLYLFSSMIILRGAVFHPEAYLDLHNFLDNRSPFVKIFDAERHRVGAYQSREFSYVVDSIDANFILYSSKIGVVHFYSFSFYLLVILITLLTIKISNKYYCQRSFFIQLIISSLYLTSPAAFLTANYYRSSKILTSFFIVLLIYLILTYLEKNKTNNKLLILISICAFLMSTSDKQGAFFVLSFSAISFLIFVLERKLKKFMIFISFIISSCAYIVYSDYLGPWLIKYFSGTPPPTYGSFLDFINTYKVILNNFFNSLLYLFYQFAYFFGNSSILAGSMICIILTISFIYLFVFKKRKNDSDKIILSLPLLLLISSLGLISLMLVYSINLLTWPDVRIVYYNLPFVTLIFLFVSLLISRLTLIYPKIKNVVIAFLLIFLMLNIKNIPVHYATLKNGHLKQSFNETAGVRKCITLRNINVKEFSLNLSQNKEACIFMRSILR